MLGKAHVLLITIMMAWFGELNNHSFDHLLIYCTFPTVSVLERDYFMTNDFTTNLSCNYKAWQERKKNPFVCTNEQIMLLNK